MNINLAEIAKNNPKWTLDELVEVVNQLLPQYLPNTRGNTKVRDEINPRLIRHYTSLGMLDEPLKDGKFALYVYRHLLQVLVVRRLLSEGVSASAIDHLALSKSNSQLESLLSGGLQLEVTPANPALTYLEKLKRLSQYPSTKSASPPPPNIHTSWIRIEITPGLEIHISSEFKEPKSVYEEELIMHKITEKLREVIKDKTKEKP